MFVHSAKRCDALLKGGFKGLDGDGVEHEMFKIMVVFRYLDGKDYFEVPRWSFSLSRATSRSCGLHAPAQLDTCTHWPNRLLECTSTTDRQHSVGVFGNGNSGGGTDEALRSAFVQLYRHNTDRPCLSIYL